MLMLTSISLSSHGFLFFRFSNSLNIFFLSINLKGKDRFSLPIIFSALRMIGWFSYFFIAWETGSVILGLVIQSPRLLSLLRLGTIISNSFVVSVSEIVSLIITQNTHADISIVCPDYV